ncbi:hypothetical protein SAMN05443247_11725 [Bradyrhizobium erythrophlei]|jgi:hypothetical protein|nr:hypothetical protein SAMN05443247_08794 [Bradyrhizobium erythrophlei]SIO67399.1 hypothetical protein SAMN05443247_11725 [Bradyrhizobium erythrophlei]
MRSNLGTFATALLASAFATAAWSQGLGRVNFETSCTPQAQEKFDRGLAMVHSFFYPDSVQAFTEAAAADPQCAIAYWGIGVDRRRPYPHFAGSVAGFFGAGGVPERGTITKCRHYPGV